MGLAAIAWASPTWCWKCRLAQYLTSISTSYSSFFHFNPCSLKRRVSGCQTGDRCSKCGVSPTYSITLVTVYSKRPEAWSLFQLYFPLPTLHLESTAVSLTTSCIWHVLSVEVSAGDWFWLITLCSYKYSYSMSVDIYKHMCGVYVLSVGVFGCS